MGTGEVSKLHEQYDEVLRENESLRARVTELERGLDEAVGTRDALALTNVEPEARLEEAEAQSETNGALQDQACRERDAAEARLAEVERERDEAQCQVGSMAAQARELLPADYDGDGFEMDSDFDAVWHARRYAQKRLATQAEEIERLRQENEMLKGLGQATIDKVHAEHEREMIDLLNEQNGVQP